MKKYFLVGLLFVIALAVSSLCIGQDMTLESCNDVIQKSCTKCHDTGRICHELDESDADWPRVRREIWVLRWKLPSSTVSLNLKIRRNWFAHIDTAHEKIDLPPLRRGMWHDLSSLPLDLAVFCILPRTLKAKSAAGWVVKEKITIPDE